MDSQQVQGHRPNHGKGTSEAGSRQVHNCIYWMGIWLGSRGYSGGKGLKLTILPSLFRAEEDWSDILSTESLMMAAMQSTM